MAVQAANRRGWLVSRVGDFDISVMQVASAPSKVLDALELDLDQPTGPSLITIKQIAMASAARSLRLICRSCRSQRPAQNIGPKVFVAWKSVGGGVIKEIKESSTDGQKPTPFDHWAQEDIEVDLKYRNMKPSDIAKDIFSDDERDLFGELASELASIADTDLRKEQDDARDLSRPLRAIGVKPKRDSFWDEDEDDVDLISDDDSDEFDENDMTDIAHAKLEEHREQRAYARLAIWEMPLLSRKWTVPS
jgi:hypothetical protein